MESAVIGGVFALRKATILLHTGARFGDLLRILVRDALSALVVSLGVRFRPPIAQVPPSIELASLVVEPVDDLVPDNGANCTIVNGIVQLRIEEGRLEDAGGEIDGVGLCIFVRI